MLKDISEITEAELSDMMKDIWKLQAILETAEETAIQTGQGTLYNLTAAGLDYVKSIAGKIEPYI